MRAMRSPIAAIHGYAFYVLLMVGAIHIAAVVLTEVRGGGNLISAMFTGKKIMRAPLADAGTEETGAVSASGPGIAGSSESASK